MTQIRRDRNGVILRYETDIVAIGRAGSDRHRTMVLGAERALKRLETILDALELSNIGQERVDAACHRIEAALSLLRTRLDE